MFFAYRSTLVYAGYEDQFLGSLLKRFVIGRDDYRSVLTANEKPCFALLAELRRLR